MPAQALHIVQGALQEDISRKEKFMQQRLEMDMLLLRGSAEEMEGDDQPDKVAELRAANLESLELLHKMQCHREVLQKLKTVYRYDAQTPVDFRKYIESETASIAARKPFTPENDPSTKSFEEAVWKQKHPNEPMPGEEDDDILMDAAGLPNNHCPITMIAVSKLVDPVRGAKCRHIYEKAAIFEYMVNFKACPMAGCSAILTRATVTCNDETLRLEIRREAARELASEHLESRDITELE